MLTFLATCGLLTGTRRTCIDVEPKWSGKRVEPCTHRVPVAVHEDVQDLDEVAGRLSLRPKGSECTHSTAQ